MTRNDTDLAHVEELLGIMRDLATLQREMLNAIRMGTGEGLYLSKIDVTKPLERTEAILARLQALSDEVPQ